jgi:perosamine synthetase
MRYDRRIIRVFGHSEPRVEGGPRSMKSKCAANALDQKRIPVAAPDLQGNEESYLVEALRSSWISSTGPFVNRFEREFADVCGTKSCISVCNGTVALHLALLGLDVRPGDEVLVPSLTYVATANAVRYVGAEPVFVDVDPKTWCIDPELLESSITRRTKGIIAVHLYGHPADMDTINHLAAVHGLWVVEDAAEAHMARYKGAPVGGLSHVATFSFYGNKIFTSGEGGALTLNDKHLELRLRTLRGQGMDPQRRYYFPVTGYNFRLTNLACSLLCAQIERRNEIIARRREIFANYDRLLSGISGIGFQPAAAWAEPAPWLYSILVNERDYGCSREVLTSRLQEEGIETRPFFLALHRLPPFREESRRRREVLSVTDRLSAGGLNLPTYAALTDADQEHIVQVVRDCQRN